MELIFYGKCEKCSHDGELTKDCICKFCINKLNNVVTPYKVYKATHYWSGCKYYIVSESRKQAVDFYEDVIDGEVKAYLKNWGCLDDHEYEIKKVSERQLDKVRIPEPCGMLWDNPVTSVIEKEIAAGKKLPYLVCESR